MRIYFYCVPVPETGPVPFQHLTICLAEGLQALGHPCTANTRYWPLDADRTRFLLEADPEITPDDCDLVIVSDDWFTWGNRAMPAGLFHPGRRYRTVALDRQDGTRLRTLEQQFRDFDLVLRTHFNEATAYPANFRPWAYGLSERILQMTAPSPASPRKPVILANWRHTCHPHSVRLAVERAFLPRVSAVIPVDATHELSNLPLEDAYDRVLWHETGKRHSPQYYSRLRESEACACFGGFFVTRYPADKAGLVSRVLKQLLLRSHLHSTLISQFDSWRLWESLAAGCCTLHLDFQRYGCVLPVQPLAGTHYIGLDLRNIGAAIEMLSDVGLRTRIAQAGRAWAYEHYTPRATAARLLAHLR